MIDRAQRKRLIAEGLFDPEFYRKQYARELPREADALEHFMAVGLPSGYLPSASFDPVLYRMLVPECGAANPLLHSLESRTPFRPPPLRDVFPQVTFLPPRGRAPAPRPPERPEGGKRKRTYSSETEESAGYLYTVDGHTYTLRRPDHQELLGRLRENRPYAYARLPHGFWDTLWMLDVAEQAVSADERARGLSAAERHAIAERLSASVRRGKGNFAARYIDEVLAAVPLHTDHPDFLRAVSFRAPGKIDNASARALWPPPDEVLRLFARHYRPEETLYDANLWKRLLVGGQLKALPGLVRDHPVVLVANNNFAQLGARWDLPDCTHIRIPPNHSQSQRWTLLERISQALTAAASRGSRAPVLISQCGGSLAYWLITRLFPRHPKVFYLDLGQALDGWFLDIMGDKTPWPGSYARRIIASCELEPFYRKILGKGYDAWLAGLR
jgi:hypothetical protein